MRPMLLGFTTAIISGLFSFSVYADDYGIENWGWNKKITISDDDYPKYYKCLDTINVPLPTETDSFLFGFGHFENHLYGYSETVTRKKIDPSDGNEYEYVYIIHLYTPTGRFYYEVPTVGGFTDSYKMRPELDGKIGIVFDGSPIAIVDRVPAKAETNYPRDFKIQRLSHTPKQLPDRLLKEEPDQNRSGSGDIQLARRLKDQLLRLRKRYSAELAKITGKPAKKSGKTADAQRIKSATYNLKKSYLEKLTACDDLSDPDLKKDVQELEKLFLNMDGDSVPVVEKPKSGAGHGIK